MRRSLLNKSRIAGALSGIFRRRGHKAGPTTRGSVSHVVIIDGTLASLHDGYESNAGIACKLMQEIGPSVMVHYEPGIQWANWRSLADVMFGRGINRQIKRAYERLATSYAPGDKIYLLGYSRGAYAVRSLAGVIDHIGLLRSQTTTECRVDDVYRYYREDRGAQNMRRFNAKYCHKRGSVPIEMIGVWDTVRALGVNAPILGRYSQPNHAFHNHSLGPSVKCGFQALARNETRTAYAPVMWESRNTQTDCLEQMWFRGTHGDIGGMLDGFEEARPLANIPLVWMLEKTERCGLTLPQGWRARFPQDPTAPSSGSFRGMGRWLLSRKQRKLAQDPSERIHASISVPVKPASWGLPTVFGRSAPN